MKAPAVFHQTRIATIAAFVVIVTVDLQHREKVGREEAEKILEE